MTQVEQRKLEIERVVPDFTLESINGQQVSPRDYKQKANLVIAYLDMDRCGPCKHFVQKMADSYHSYRDDETEVLVVCPQPVAELRGQVGTMALPFSVLSDARGAMRASYLGGETGQPAAVILITDRWGALRTTLTAESGDGLPSQEAILSWLDLIEMECPECGAVEREWVTAAG